VVPTSFNNETDVIDPHPFMEPLLEPLNVAKVLFPHPSGAMVPGYVTCWKVSKAELEEIQRTGRVWLVVYGESMAGVMPLGFAPEISPLPGSDK